MAPGGSRSYRSPRQNLPLLNSVEDELARDPGAVGDPHLGNTSLAPSCNPISGPELVPTLILALFPTPAPPSSNKLFKQFMRIYLELDQGPGQPSAEREQSFKAKVPEVYYGKLHMNWYHFCQQCKDHFETTGTNGTYRTPFATFFLCKNISVH